MRLIIIDYLFIKELASAIYWTLIHSLWQGLTFALLAGLTMAATRRSSSNTRYTILSGLLLLFIGCSCCTFVLKCSDAFSAGSAHPAPFNTFDAVSAPVSGHPFMPGVSASKQTLIQQAADYLSLHATLITAVWFVILALRLLNLGLSMRYMQKIKRTGIHHPSGDWKDKLALLCERLRISKPVLLLESEIIKMPAVFGFLKPVIFVPLGLLSQLPPGQVESILMHELAHIRRNDYLVNLLQNFIATVFFFNPAVLWMSSLIRDERENCCDDVVLSMTKSKRHLVEALINARTFPAVNPAFALAFPGQGDQLINRVARIVKMKNKTLHPLEQIFLLCCFFAGTFVLYSFSLPVVKNKPPEIVHSNGIGNAGSSRSKSRETPSPDTKQFSFGSAPAKKEAAPSSATHADTAHQYTPSRGALYYELKHADTHSPTWDATRAKYGEQGLMEFSEKSRPVTELNAIIDKAAQQKGITPGQMTNEDIENAVKAGRTENMIKTYDSTSFSEQRDRHAEVVQAMRSIIVDLIAENIVKDKSGISSFALTADELYVNDKKEPDDLQKKLKQKYLKDPRFGLYYGPVKMHGTGSFLGKDDL